jgi:hypothetical protein
MADRQKPKTEAEKGEDEKLAYYQKYFKNFRAKEIIIKSAQGPAIKISDVWVSVQSYPHTQTKTITVLGTQLNDEEQKTLDSVKDETLLRK